MFFIESECFAVEQPLTESLDVLTHVMERDAIGQIRHVEGLGHLLVRYRPLFIKHRQHGAQENEAATRIEKT